MRRWQELARLAMAIAIKEENVQRETNSRTTYLPAVPNKIRNTQSANIKRQGV
jgi:hypothetical protein